jgi:DnaJ-class molecular chaperone
MKKKIIKKKCMCCNGLGLEDHGDSYHTLNPLYASKCSRCNGKGYLLEEVEEVEVEEVEEVIDDDDDVNVFSRRLGE